ncbi:alpha/beta fold hydrolase [Candidatus Nitrosocosmicus sp. T]
MKISRFISSVLAVSIIASSFVSSLLMSSLGTNLVYATTSLDQSIQQSQDELQSAINSEVQQTITETINNINNNSNSEVTDQSNNSQIQNNTLLSTFQQTDTETIDNMPSQKVIVGDTDIAYKIFGKGDPILLIPGFSMTMEMWGPILNDLAENHTVIIFDNRGIGETTTGNKSFSMEQFVNDTVGLIDALEIEKPIDVMGLSLGGMIAQELALSYPDKIKHLVLVASSCGGEESLPPQLTPNDLKQMQTGTANTTLFLHALFPDNWIRENSDSLNKTFLLPQVSQENLLRYGEAVGKWKGTCGSIQDIDKPVLVITGTEDITSPPINSLKIAEKIPGAWLIQIQGGGHGVMQQYPDIVDDIIETFLSLT